MSAEITKILLDNMPELIKDEKVEPTALILDMVWKHLKTIQPDLLEVAIGDDIGTLDHYMFNLAENNWITTAAAMQMFILRKLRAVSYETIMGYESSILDAHHCL